MKPPILSDEEIENEVDALCQSLLLHPMNLPTIKKIAIESIKGLIGEKLEEAKAEVAREIFEEIDCHLRFAKDAINGDLIEGFYDDWWQSLKPRFIGGKK